MDFSDQQVRSSVDHDANTTAQRSASPTSSSSLSSSTRAAPAILNPYAQRKAPRQLYLQPLVPETSTENNEDEGASEKAIVLMTEMETPVSTAVVLPSSVVVAEPAAQNNRMRSADLPPWERLPSRNLSFPSAEILSVTECCEHRHVYANSSVRVIGVLVHRFVHSDATVSLLLKNPLLMAHTTTTTSNSVKRQQRSTVKPAPVKQLHHQQPNGRPLPPSSAATRETARSPTPLVKSTIRPQPLKSRSATTPATNSGLLGRKRPLSSIMSSKPLVDPLEALAKAVAVITSSTSSTDIPSTCLWVVANPTHVLVNQFVVGDLVTVLGELNYHNDQEPSLQNDNRAHVPEAVLQVADKLLVVIGQKKEYSYVQARILLNSNGTNLQLFMDALKARRKLLLQAATTASTSTSSTALCSTTVTDISSTAAPLKRQGCGPPPYTSNNNIKFE